MKVERLMLAVILLAAACTKAPGATTGPGEAAAGEPATGSATVTAPASSGPTVTLKDGFVVHVELAADEQNRAQGLMYRDGLRPGTGMLFLFPAEGHYPFWMKNTRIPLDMIWIDSAKKVVHVKHRVPPCTWDPCPSYPPNVNAQYVLELAGGVAAEHAIAVGDVLRFDGMDGVRAH